eukprot:GHVS01034737.1.p1 GENE.GHVS01034737.1~~GHVS01034737.1.p1  ORF type:complete len:152 (+),score=30.44 GHVS01034737.1:81-536(+)
MRKDGGNQPAKQKVEWLEAVKKLKGEKAALEQLFQKAQREFRLETCQRKKKYEESIRKRDERILTLTRDAEIRQRRSVEGGGDAKWRQKLEKKVQDSNDRIEALITELRFTKERLHGEETKSRDLSTHAVKLEEAMEHSRLEQAAAIQQVH